MDGEKTLESLARENGVTLADRSTPCTGTNSEEKVPQCIVRPLGFEINTASFAMYAFSISVLFQALIIISMSGAADHGQYRKFLLLIFAFAGASATMLFLFVSTPVYLLGAVLAIVSNCCFGASFTLLNAFLPVLVRNHPSVQLANKSGSEHNQRQEDDEPTLVLADSTSALIQEPVGVDQVKQQELSRSPELLLSTKISSYGYGIGYSAAVLVQIMAIVVLHLTGSSTFSLRLVIFLIGVWWAVFTIPAALFLRPRPGPPLATSERGSLTTYLIHSWSLLVRTVLQVRHLQDIAIFLLAWFLLSDAQATVSGTAILFAKTELGMPPAALAFISVISTLFGVLGACEFLSSHILVFSKCTGEPAISQVMRAAMLGPLHFLDSFVVSFRTLLTDLPLSCLVLALARLQSHTFADTGAHYRRV